MITLSVDELRVAAVVADAAVPSLLDQYATAETGADAAARRGLVARGLLVGDVLYPSLAALLTPLTAPAEVVEYEAVGHRAAQVRDAAGGVTSLVEVEPDIWRLSTDAAVDALLDAATAALAERPAAPGGALALTVDAHLSLLGLLESPGAVEGLLVHHLGADGRRLADAFAPTAGAGRVIRSVRDGDVVTVERIAWLDGPAGAWRVDEGDPADLDAHTGFVPCAGSELASALADVRGRTAAVAA